MRVLCVSAALAAAVSGGHAYLSASCERLGGQLMLLQADRYPFGDRAMDVQLCDRLGEHGGMAAACRAYVGEHGLPQTSADAVHACSALPAQVGQQLVDGDVLFAHLGRRDWTRIERDAEQRAQDADDNLFLGLSSTATAHARVRAEAHVQASQGVAADDEAAATASEATSPSDELSAINALTEYSMQNNFRESRENAETLESMQDDEDQTDTPSLLNGGAGGVGEDDESDGDKVRDTTIGFQQQYLDRDPVGQFERELFSFPGGPQIYSY